MPPEEAKPPAIPPSATAQATGKSIEDLIKEYEGQKKDLQKVAETKKVIVRLPEKFVKRLMRIPFNILARFDWEGWKLTDDETNEMADAWKPILEEYLPAFIIKYFPILVAIAVTLEVVAGKLKARKEWSDAKRPKKDVVEKIVYAQVPPTPPPAPAADPAEEETAPRNLGPEPDRSSKDSELSADQARLSPGAPSVDSLFSASRKKKKQEKLGHKESLAITSAKEKKIEAGIETGKGNEAAASSLLKSLGGKPDGTNAGSSVSGA